MANPLLDRAAPAEFADRRQAFEIKAKIGDFAGLAEIIDRDLRTLAAALRPAGWRDNPVQIRLQFSWSDVQKTLPALKGRIETTVAAVCQRCLEAFELPLAVDLDLLLAPGQAGVPGDAGPEVWELEGDKVRPLDVIQESLIMALPLSAMHAPDAHCDSASPNSKNEAKEMLRPFADLKARMDDSGA